MQCGVTAQATPAVQTLPDSDQCMFAASLLLPHKAVALKAVCNVQCTSGFRIDHSLILPQRQ